MSLDGPSETHPFSSHPCPPLQPILRLPLAPPPPHLPPRPPPHRARPHGHSSRPAVQPASPPARQPKLSDRLASSAAHLSPFVPQSLRCDALVRLGPRPSEISQAVQCHRSVSSAAAHCTLASPFPPLPRLLLRAGAGQASTGSQPRHPRPFDDLVNQHGPAAPRSSSPPPASPLDRHLLPVLPLIAQRNRCAR